VVPCFSDPNGEELLLREYVAYRMFERISPNSVRARLVRVTFRDKHVEKDRDPVYCILLEHEEQVSARLRGRIVDSYNIPMDSLDVDQAALTAVFEYMIGNTDWGIEDGRNLHMLKPSNIGKIRLIPFDFDFAGLVNAPYATPKAETGLKNVKERRLMAGGISKEALRRAVETVKGAKADLILLCNAEFLSKSSVKDMNRYMETFFQTIDNVPDMVMGSKGNIR
jgi:hypothetical protein